MSHKSSEAEASAKTSQAGAGAASDRADRSFTRDSVDTDIGGAEAQKRGIVQDSNMSASDNESMRNFRDQIIQNGIAYTEAVRSQILRSQEIAIDRQWNVNETDAFATILADRIAKNLNT